MYFEHRSLLRFWLPPVLITLALIVGGDRRWRSRSRIDWPTRCGPRLRAAAGSRRCSAWLHRAFEWLIALALIGFAVVAVAALSSAIAAPFNDALSAAVESLHGEGRRRRSSCACCCATSCGAWPFETLKLAVYGAMMLGLFVFAWLVPGVGALVQTVVGGVLTALYFAIDHVDWAASRHGLSVRRAPRLRRRATWGRCSASARACGSCCSCRS